MHDYDCGPEEQLVLYERFHDRLLSPRVSYDPGDQAGRRVLLENLEARMKLHESLGELDAVERLCVQAVDICEQTPVDDVAAVDSVCIRLKSGCEPKSESRE